MRDGYHNAMSDTIHFASIAHIPYGGGCATEPALFTLNYLLDYRADMQVGGQRLPQAPVAQTLRDVLTRPEHYGVSPGTARRACDQFIEQGGQALEAVGGDRAWLAKELTLPDN